MNIKEAKEEIKNAMIAYFSKDEFGNYIIPIEKQRPVFLLGAPGIGKTAIMEQVAQELKVGLVSYSMTHHTRQSALGLPFIETKNYGGREYSISEYTMSEIIASVYDKMEETGLKEGILFLDEINCVSETLAPAMLQFLQYKTFGRHAVPDGWIIVTAGNPPEYNNSVREFDIVTWDRLKKISVEADYTPWKEYAINHGIHPSVTTYLDIKKNNFYKIESTVDGKSFVTARGWSDLSDMITLYEKNNIDVKERLVGQYLQNPKIAKDFAIYYDLFNKYKSDYQIDEIMKGTYTETILNRAKAAKFDERLSLLGLLLDAVSSEMKSVYYFERSQYRFMELLKQLRVTVMGATSDPSEALNKIINTVKDNLKSNRAAGTITADEEYIENLLIRVADEQYRLLQAESPEDGKTAFMMLKKSFDGRTAELKKLAESAGNKLSNVFKFCEKAFNEGNEILILVTELTISKYCAHFISRYGCKEYFNHNKELLFYERQKEIIVEMGSLELE